MSADQPDDAKKTDTLQIRLSSETKSEFIETCQRNGTSASDVLRKAISDYLQLYRRSSSTLKGYAAIIPKPIRKKRYFAAAGIAIVFGIFATMPTAAADPDFAALFRQMDRNNNGSLSGDEFLTRESEWGSKSKPLKPGEEFAPGPGEFAIMSIEPGGMLRPMITGFGDQTQAMYRVKLTGSELDAHRRFLSEIAMAFHDSNGDGMVSLEEFEWHYRREAMESFVAADRNLDGHLDRSEVKSGKRYEPGPPVANSPDELFREIPVSAEERFASLDLDRNGRVTSDEYLVPHMKYVELVYLTP